jgi:hypothetical protein
MGRIGISIKPRKSNLVHEKHALGSGFAAATFAML